MKEEKNMSKLDAEPFDLYERLIEFKNFLDNFDYDEKTRWQVEDLIDRLIEESGAYTTEDFRLESNLVHLKKSLEERGYHDSDKDLLEKMIEGLKK
jgi:hypothetical protein